MQISLLFSLLSLIHLHGSFAIAQSSVYHRMMAEEQLIDPFHRRMIGLDEASSARRGLSVQNSSWQTLSGSAPLIVSRGDNGIFPDQTELAYKIAMLYSLPSSSVFLCDVQLTKDGVPICRTGLDLGLSTNINITLPGLHSEYTVNGQLVSGFFSIDITFDQIMHNITAVQSNLARPPTLLPAFILTPDIVYEVTNGPLWINVEYPTFYSQQKLNISHVIASLRTIAPMAYVSSPEVVFLKAVKPLLPKTTHFVLKFRGKDEIEPSTNQTYGSLLQNLTSISTYASGILVPKDYIWAVDNDTGYLLSESTLISDAHTAKLAIYAYDFVNELYNPSIFNYSFNPILEYLQYAPSQGSNVDGFFTDFPTTASKALACYRDAAAVNQTRKQPLIISRSGASGDYPGCTLLAYENAVKGGANYIDCPIQITKDGIAICRESPDLLTNTDISLNPDFFPSRVSSIPALQPSKGIYTFNLTLEEIKSLKATINASEYGLSGVKVNGGYDGQYDVLTLSEFLTYAKNQSVNILVDIQNGYFLNKQLGLDVVGAVISSLNIAGLNNSDQVLIQSEDSAVLKSLNQSANYTLAYRVADINVTITPGVVKQIKDLATYATLPRGLIQPTFDAYLLNKTNVVDLFHAENMSVFVSFLRNVFVTIPNDYGSDPTSEIATMVEVFKVDGLITKFPATAKAYLSNGCLNTNASDYHPGLVNPGEFLTYILPGYYTPSAPGSILDVTHNESDLSPPNLSNTTNNAPPAASPTRSPASSSTETRYHVPYYTTLLTIIMITIASRYPSATI